MTPMIPSLTAFTKSFEPLSLGEFKHPQLIPPEASSIAARTPRVLHGEEEKRLFVAFAAKMLRWLPEERATAGELYGDPWLSSGV